MRTALAAVARAVRVLLRLLAWGTLVAVLAASLGVYLTVTGTSRPLVGLCATGVGALLAGQHTEAVRAAVDIHPAERWLGGSAALRVRSTTAGRRRLFFLLNPGLQLRTTRWTAPSPDLAAPRAYRLWALTILDLGRPLGKDEVAEVTLEYHGAPLLNAFPIDGAAALEPGNIILTPNTWWYPVDLQGWFEAEVNMTLPAGLTVVHGGTEAAAVTRGDIQQVGWKSERPVHGVSVVAGSYTATAREREGLRLQLFVPAGVPLDATRVLDELAAGTTTLTDRYGTPGFTAVSAFVSRTLLHGSNDGAGVIGVPLRAIRRGDYGAAALGHQLARNWWGATVGDRPLAPRTGGVWVMEGLAAYSGLLAARLHPGSDGWTRAVSRWLPDPTRPEVLRDLSAVDARLAPGDTGGALGHRAAFAVAMLREVLGEEAFTTGLRRFLERHRLQQVEDEDLQRALEQASGKSLQPFFDDWTRAARTVDLYLESGSAGDVSVRARGDAVTGPALEVWRVARADPAPARATARVGDTLPGPDPTGFMLLDPGLLWPDGYRANNRFPRRENPFAVVPSAAGRVAVVSGDPSPWAPSRITLLTAEGVSSQTWDFPRGIAHTPIWAADGSQLVVVSEQPAGETRSVEVLAVEGARRTVGAGTDAAPGAATSIYVARGDRLLRIAADGSIGIVAQRRGCALADPRPAPDGTLVAYTAARGARLDLRVTGADGQNDRLLLAWERDRFVYRWAPDGSRVYAIAPGTWDWQIWAIPLTGNIDVLASGAATIADLAVSPDGSRLAFIAAPNPAAPSTTEVYVMHLAERSVRTIPVEQADPLQLAWTDGDQLLLVAESRPPQRPWTLPAERSVKRLRPSDGSVTAWP